MYLRTLFGVVTLALLLEGCFGHASGFQPHINERQSPGKCLSHESTLFPVLLDIQNGLQQPLGSGHIGANERHDGHSDAPPLEISRLIISGPSVNRVDLVFFSDGYLPDEKGKFLLDAQQLAEDVSRNQTFNTVQPLLNFWAAFSPSKESGIGVGGKPKDTPFGLYRDGTELRGVYYSKPGTARAACDSLGTQCDYPILLGNDPLYGGLGGEFTVVTSSLLNGPLVLRHELGHSIIDVGEEYDGGFAYFGANAASNLSAPIPWDHWLTSHSQSQQGPPRVERSVMPMQQYPWTMLKPDQPWKIHFESSGMYARHVVRFSLSGLPEASDLSVQLDGIDLGWEPKPGLGVDRWHYDIHINQTLSQGTHELVFALKNADREGIAQLCSAEILEFGDETEFVSKPGHYGLFPTYSDSNQTSYRPTNEDCLMRVVTSPNLCKVCLESLWLHLLERISFIEGFTETCVPSGSGGTSARWKKVLGVKLVPLAQLRTPLDPSAAHLLPKETYKIIWMRNRHVLHQFTNQTSIEIADDDDALGRYTVKVEFSSDEIRVHSKLLKSGGHYHVKEKCVQ